MSKKTQIQNLIALLTLFKDKPNILADFLFEYKAFNIDFNDILSNNKALQKIWMELDETNEIEIPYFMNLESMDKYYRNFFKKDKTFISLKNKKDDILIEELKQAIKNEDFETATKIRDILVSKKVDINKFL